MLPLSCYSTRVKKSLIKFSHQFNQNHRYKLLSNDLEKRSELASLEEEENSLKVIELINIRVKQLLKRKVYFADYHHNQVITLKSKKWL